MTIFIYQCVHQGSLIDMMINIEGELKEREWFDKMIHYGGRMGES